jgi:siroheme decarboxylase
MSLDDLDRRLLEVSQSGFPITERPFQVLAEQVGCSEEEVLERMRWLQASGTVREVGPVFDLWKLGYTSTLCAARVREPFVEQVAETVNAYAEVTHNYLRDDPLNMWFTLIAPSEERIEAILDRIRKEEGVEEVLSLPAERMFKIKVHFSTAKDAP